MKKYTVGQEGSQYYTTLDIGYYQMHFTPAVRSGLGCRDLSVT